MKSGTMKLPTTKKMDINRSFGPSLNTALYIAISNNMTTCQLSKCFCAMDMVFAFKNSTHTCT